MTSIPLTPSLNSSQFAYEGKDPQKIDETAKKFTSLFYTQFVSELLKEQENMGGFGEEMFQSFLAEYVAEELTMSEAGKDMVATISQQLIQLQEKNKRGVPDSTSTAGEGR